LYARVIFFPLAVDGLVEPLGYVEAVHHGLGVRQQLPTSMVEGHGHVGPVRLHLLPLRFGQLFQAFPGRRLVPPVRHRQHLGLSRVGQIGQDRGIQLVPLPQAQLVDPDIGDPPLRVNLLGLGVGQLVADDQADRLGGDAQAPGHFLLVTADQQPQHVPLEAVGVAGVLALEGRDQPLSMVAPRATMERRLIDPEARLPADIQVPDDLDPVLELKVGFVFPPAAVTATALGQRPGDFKPVAVPMTVIPRDGDTGRQIDVDSDGSHGRRTKRSPCIGCRDQAGIPTETLAKTRQRESPKPRGLHL